ncbi:MAG: SGNH/GDSL hydrolase family protein [Victivallaceae bacterium]
MNPLLVYLISGEAFFPGLALLALGFGLMPLPEKPWRQWSDAAVVFGLLILVITPVSLPYYTFEALLLGCAVGWLLLRKSRRLIRKGWLLLLFPLAMLAVELPYYLRPAPVHLTGKLWVIGDSISAGTGFAGEKTWSELGNADSPDSIVNRSVGGGTAQSALATLAKCDPRPGDAILFEIGGNDLLGGVSGLEFGRRLDALLARAAAYKVPLVMFELPLPPLCNRYGEAQRRLARKYHVSLIPRRDFAAVFKGRDSTTDGLHLSNAGQRKMYEVVRNILYR